MRVPELARRLVNQVLGTRRYTIRNGRIQGFVERCLRPGSRRPRVTCT